MADQTPQSFASHAKLVPVYHFVALPILLVNLLWSLYQVATMPSVQTGFGVLVAFALVVVGLFARVFALGAQDRVIRLEERLRMERLFPEDLKARIQEFETPQLIALRFASDDELEGLARKVLDDGIVDLKTIKQMVTTWKADHQRL